MAETGMTNNAGNDESEHYAADDQATDTLPDAAFQRNRSPLLTYGSLLNRPRSNPRSRTPMRYESPLEADAFRRSTVAAEPEQQGRQSVGRRVSVRPMAGAAVGTTTQRTNHRSLLVTKSSKQGPSKRKVKRWINDSFKGLAAEIASASSRGPAVAEILLQAQADSALYKSYYDPRECPALHDFYEKKSLQGVRDEFFRGEIGVGSWNKINTSRKKHVAKPDLMTPEFMASRVHARLQKVIRRLQSSPSIQVIDKFERFLIQSFDSGKHEPPVSCWDNILVEPPKVEKVKQRQVMRFVFDQDAGLYRLFLHAVCQFHGLQVASFEQQQKARCLVVSGLVVEGAEYRLMDHVSKDVQGIKSTSKSKSENAQSNAPVESLTDTMSTLKVK